MLVKVQPALSLAVVTGHFRATMYPALQGEMLQLEQHTAAGWPIVESAAAGRHGHAAFTTPPTSGQWRVRYPGDAIHLRGHSALFTVS